MSQRELELSELIDDNLIETVPHIKETEKYTRISTVILDKILDELKRSNGLSKTIPFQLENLNKTSKTCCKCDSKGNNNESGGSGGLFKLLAGYGAYKL